MQFGSIPGGTTRLRSKIMKVVEFQTFSDFLFCLRQRKICNFRYICRAGSVAFCCKYDRYDLYKRTGNT